MARIRLAPGAGVALKPVPPVGGDQRRAGGASAHALLFPGGRRKWQPLRSGAVGARTSARAGKADRNGFCGEAPHPANNFFASTTRRQQAVGPFRHPAESA